MGSHPILPSCTQREFFKQHVTMHLHSQARSVHTSQGPFLPDVENRLDRGNHPTPPAPRGSGSSVLLPPTRQPASSPGAEDPPSVRMNHGLPIEGGLGWGRLTYVATEDPKPKSSSAAHVATDDGREDVASTNYINQGWSG